MANQMVHIWIPVDVLILWGIELRKVNSPVARLGCFMPA